MTDKYIYTDPKEGPIEGTLEDMYKGATALGHDIIVTSMADGKQYTINAVRRTRPYPFKRSQVSVKVHTDDKANIHQYARTLNNAREKSILEEYRNRGMSAEAILSAEAVNELNP